MHSPANRSNPVGGLPMEEGFSDAFPYSLLLHPSKNLYPLSCMDRLQSRDSTHALFSTLSTAAPSSACDVGVSRNSMGEETSPIFPLQKANESNGFVPIVPVKLFVNRVPKMMGNEDLRSLFSQYGEILECYILKGFDGHKGCAFVKFSSIVDAHKAIIDLHGKKILNEEAGPVQLKYADGEIERLGLSPDVQPGGEAIKVFVGCLPKSCAEDELFNIFSRFGRVDEVFLIRDENKKSKCSAFVTFPKNYMALSAIDALDHKYTLPKSGRPIEVRLARSKFSKQRTKLPAGNKTSNPHYGSSSLLSKNVSFSPIETLPTPPASHVFSPLSDMPTYPNSIPPIQTIWNISYQIGIISIVIIPTHILNIFWASSLLSNGPPSSPPGYYMTPTSLNGNTGQGSTSLLSAHLGTASGLIEDTLFPLEQHPVRERNRLASTYSPFSGLSFFPPSTSIRSPLANTTPTGIQGGPPTLFSSLPQQRGIEGFPLGPPYPMVSSFPSKSTVQNSL
ncbi:hypothetical protein IE077_003180 [Cardiosporidium cionae]|uniref:RRM domain-containing protein n=1 Tax=Cardiosporidium cionae TaxID=476202 RepID=A0ABQ7J8W0_9APIC|nr:hypothetical protein IE077_003180 [Cardiosporidium cionae]|eukprot:KAF8820432.1 hypothetical protein IE077_003180 [Cardiosporidium cionae]